MKKFLIITSVVLVLILSVVSYFHIFGGKPHIENFEQLSDDYETIAQLASDTYREVAPDEEYIIIDIYDGNLKYNETILSLTREQQDIVLSVSESFNYLRVCNDAVFFCDDETGYYGLVYSKSPLTALYKAEVPQKGREYHRINSCWYEWGVWGR